MNKPLRELWQINKYLWMSLGFVLLYLPLAQLQGLIVAPLWMAWGLLGLALVDGAARSLLAWKRGGSLAGGWAVFFTAMDFTLISGAVAITKGIESDLWLLYFVVMTFESLYQTSLYKRALDGSVTLAYFVATWPAQMAPASSLSNADYFRILASRLFFIILVSALARRISVNANLHSQELAILREQKATAEERSRIAREVHDGLGHALVSVILRLELCTRLLRKAPDEAEAILKEEVPALRAAWNEGRDLAFHLRPWEADIAPQEPLPDVLQRHIGRFAERTGLGITLKADTGDWLLRPAFTVGLTRMVQEALTNVAKHAQASSVEIHLSQTPQSILTCQITDNGQGFDSTQTALGVGLQSIQERAESLGGSLTLTSQPGQGTCLRITLPFED